MVFGAQGIEILGAGLAFLCVCAVVGLIVWGARRKRRDMAALGSQELAYRLVTDDIWKTSEDLRLAQAGNQTWRVGLVRRAFRKRTRLRSGLVVGAMICATIALLRPQWGTVQEEIHRKGVDIVFLVDSSESMKAKDVSPSRIETAQSAIASLLKSLEGNRMGLVGFASTTRLHCPLTLDSRGLKSILDNSISFGIGTDIEVAISESLRVLASSKALAKAVIVLSDGEGHTGDVGAAIETAVKEGVRIFTIGIGTAEGGPIPETDEDGSENYKKRNGEVVWTKLDETTLSRLADETGGMYVRLSATEKELEQLGAAIGSLDQTEFSQTMTTRKADRFSWFLFVAVLLLVIEACLSDYRRIAWESEHD